MQVSPYLFFYGRTEEAMKFYQSALGGELEISRNGDSPMGDDVSKEWRDKVMHATLKGDGFDVMASDGREGSPQEKESNISLAIGLADESESQRSFRQALRRRQRHHASRKNVLGSSLRPIHRQIRNRLDGQLRLQSD